MIITVPKNTLTPANKGALSKKGFIVIECDEPEKVRVISAEQNIDANDYFMAALLALNTSVPATKSERFIAELYRRLRMNESAIEPNKETVL